MYRIKPCHIESHLHWFFGGSLGYVWCPRWCYIAPKNDSSIKTACRLYVAPFAFCVHSQRFQLPSPPCQRTNAAFFLFFQTAGGVSADPSSLPLRLCDLDPIHRARRGSRLIVERGPSSISNLTANTQVTLSLSALSAPAHLPRLQSRSAGLGPARHSAGDNATFPPTPFPATHPKNRPLSLTAQQR